MRAPVLGAVECEPGFGCTVCDSRYDGNIISNFIHDLKCWGWSTALYNLKVRLTNPEWFIV